MLAAGAAVDGNLAFASNQERNSCSALDFSHFLRKFTIQCRYSSSIIVHLAAQFIFEYPRGQLCQMRSLTVVG